MCSDVVPFRLSFRRYIMPLVPDTFSEVLNARRWPLDLSAVGCSPCYARSSRPSGKARCPEMGPGAGSLSHGRKDGRGEW
jgi:hypothetical protein